MAIGYAGAVATLWTCIIPALLAWKVRKAARNGNQGEGFRAPGGILMIVLVILFGVLTAAFHLRHPAMCRALMLFDTGPGFKKDDAREAWNQRARQRGDDLEAKGFAALGGGLRGAAGQVGGLSRGVGVGLDAGGQLLHGRSCLLQAGSRLLGAIAQVLAA